MCSGGGIVCGDTAGARRRGNRHCDGKVGRWRGGGGNGGGICQTEACQLK